MTVPVIVALLGDIAALEPVALNLVLSLVNGLKGKSDAEVLAADASDWTSIIATAHAQAQPKA